MAELPVVGWRPGVKCTPPQNFNAGTPSKTDIDYWNSLDCGIEYACDLDVAQAALEQARAEVERLRVDAERYRVIRAGYIDLAMQVRIDPETFEIKTIRANLNHGDEGEGQALDAICDAALKSPTPGKDAPDPFLQTR